MSHATQRKEKADAVVSNDSEVTVPEQRVRYDPEYRQLHVSW
jgi:hypothetical protein